MNKTITITLNYEIVDDGVIIEDGDFSPISFRVSNKIYELLVHSKDFLEIEKYVMNKTDYPDLLMEKIEEEAEYLSGDFMELNITIDGIYEDELLEKVIDIINNPSELTITFQDGVFVN